MIFFLHYMDIHVVCYMDMLMDTCGMNCISNHLTLTHGNMSYDPQGENFFLVYVHKSVLKWSEEVILY